MEDGSIVDQIPVDFCRSQHHIGTGVPVKGKGAVSLAVKLYEGKGRGNLFVNHQTGHINAAFHKGLAEKIAKSVFADFSDECCFAAQTGIHGKDIGGCTAGIPGKQFDALCIGSVRGKVDQAFSQSYNIKHGITSTCFFSVQFGHNLVIRTLTDSVEEQDNRCYQPQHTGK